MVREENRLLHTLFSFLTKLSHFILFKKIKFLNNILLVLENVSYAMVNV